MACIVEAQQKAPTDYVLELAVVLYPVPGSAEQPRKFLPPCMRVAGDKVVDKIDVCRMDLPAAVNNERCHGAYDYPICGENARKIFR